ncbi:hypothetical protein ABH924_004323 [Arthrobacter sp. GAS37]
MDLDKSVAVQLFEHHGLETHPAKVFSRVEAARAHLLSACTHDRVVVRTFAALTMRLNLPRLVGVSPQEAAEWLTRHAQGLGVIVQPFDPVLSSAELVVDSINFQLEIIPGIWELDNRSQPARIFGALLSPASWVIEHGKQASLARFALPGGLSDVRRASPDSVTIARYSSWLTSHVAAIQSIRSKLAFAAVGLKLHCTISYGISPQNLRLAERVGANGEPDAGSQSGEWKRIHKGNLDEISDDTAILLDVSVAREDATKLRMIAAELQERGVRTVAIDSGQLSHLAIILREAGLRVVRKQAQPSLVGSEEHRRTRPTAFG